MKKIYSKPTAEISNVQPVSVIASSISFSDVTADGDYPGGGDAPAARIIDLLGGDAPESHSWEFFD